MQEFAAEHPTRTIALLDAYLEAPLKVVPGTKMAFAGIPDESRRAEVIAFLRSLSADPVPIAGADE
jgi:cytochrome c